MPTISVKNIKAVLVVLAIIVIAGYSCYKIRDTWFSERNDKTADSLLLLDKQSGSTAASNGAAFEKPEKQGQILATLDVKTQKIVAEKHARYDPFLHQRGLTPAQKDRFVALMMEKDQARADLQASVKKLGLAGSDPTVEAMRTELYQPIEDQLKELLGPVGYAAYQQYEGISYFVSYVNPSYFSALNAPLSDDQIMQLANIISPNDHPVRQHISDIGLTTTVNWDAVLEEAAPILNSEQMAVLQQQVRIRTKIANQQNRSVP